MTSGGFLIPLFPRYSPQANSPVSPFPQRVASSHSVLYGRLQHRRGFTSRTQNVRFRAFERTLRKKLPEQPFREFDCLHYFA